MAEEANVDILENLKGLGDIGLDGELPSRKDMMKMLDEANVTDEMRESLRSLLGGSAPQVFGTSGGAWLGWLFILMILMVLFFFGYKLYKSIKDKELKRQEKKKAKQMKKKK